MKPRSENDLPEIITLRRLIDYDHTTGILRWKPRADEEFEATKYPASRIANMWNKNFAGKTCGCDNGSGYLVLRIYQMSLKAHRVAFAIHHGRWPSDMIDHISGNKSDNRIENLREATRSQNLQNQRVRIGASSYKGVSFDKSSGSWFAQIRLNKKNKRIGFFDNEESAAEAYDAAAHELFGDFARVNFPPSNRVSAIL